MSKKAAKLGAKPKQTDIERAKQWLLDHAMGDTEKICVCSDSCCLPKLSRELAEAFEEGRATLRPEAVAAYSRQLDEIVRSAVQLEGDFKRLMQCTVQQPSPLQPKEPEESVCPTHGRYTRNIHNACPICIMQGRHPARAEHLDSDVRDLVREFMHGSVDAPLEANDIALVERIVHFIEERR
jgi:hypothetical protein